MKEGDERAEGIDRRVIKVRLRSTVGCMSGWGDEKMEVVEVAEV